VLIEAENLTRRYGKGQAAVTALAKASFAIGPGSFVAIVGPSGSGKSTLMNLIGLLDRPTSGRLAFKGTDVTRLSHDRLAAIRNREIGFVFQTYNLLARHTALENVELPLIYAGVGRRARLRRAEAALEAVGLAYRHSHAPSELSGGEQQRVSIARALVGDPALVLADEPTGALDSRTGADILALFQALNDAGRSIVMITHDPNVACRARRIIRLQDGAIVEDSETAAPLVLRPTRAAPLLLRAEDAVAS
jgi:putative ABC transport system ATP-binding protein